MVAGPFFLVAAYPTSGRECTVVRFRTATVQWFAAVPPSGAAPVPVQPVARAPATGHAHQYEHRLHSL